MRDQVIKEATLHIAPERRRMLELLLGNLEAHAPAMSSASGSGLDRVPVPRSARRSSDRQA
jgi:hypothetical protein